MFGLKFEAFLFAHILDFDRVEGSDFKCDNSFSKLHPKNTQIRHCWSQVQKKNCWPKLCILTVSCVVI